MAGGCGSCGAADNPVGIIYPDLSTFTLGDPVRSMAGNWTQASFPSVPCPSPQNITWEFKEGGVWKGITTGGTVIKLSGGSNVQSANAGTTYYRNVEFLVVGSWQIRIKMACGPSFFSPIQTQVVVAGGRRTFLVD